MQNISELIIGIKHKGKFEILDSWGKIVDKVISDNQYFDVKYFPNISGTYTTERVLCNNDTENYLKVTAHDIIYRHKSETADYEEEYKKFCDRVTKNLIPNIINDYNVENFIRIGIVFNIKLDTNSQYSKLIQNIINPKIKNVNDIRFSRKEATNTGNLFSENNDYINKIYTMSIKEDKTPSLIYDYQYYFNPIKADFRQCNIEKIFKDGKDNMEKDIKYLLGEIDER